MLLKTLEKDNYNEHAIIHMRRYVGTYVGVY